MERAHHPRDVAKRAALAAPLGEPPIASASDPEDDEVLAGEERAAEVEIAVRTDLLRVDALREDGIEPGEDLVLYSHEQRGWAACIARELVNVAPKACEDTADHVPCALVLRALIHRRVRSRLERRI